MCRHVGKAHSNALVDAFIARSEGIVQDGAEP
jgi:hypothetical protein